MMNFTAEVSSAVVISCLRSNRFQYVIHNFKHRYMHEVLLITRCSALNPRLSII
jgi:hypothetical protein